MGTSYREDHIKGLEEELIRQRKLLEEQKKREEQATLEAANGQEEIKVNEDNLSQEMQKQENFRNLQKKSKDSPFSLRRTYDKIVSKIENEDESSDLEKQALYNAKNLVKEHKEDIKNKQEAVENIKEKLLKESEVETPLEFTKEEVVEKFKDFRKNNPIRELSRYMSKKDLEEWRKKNKEQKNK